MEKIKKLTKELIEMREKCIEVEKEIEEGVFGAEVDSLKIEIQFLEVALLTLRRKIEYKREWEEYFERFREQERYERKSLPI